MIKYILGLLFLCCLTTVFAQSSDTLDLLAHRFDIAMGGISKTKATEKLFLMSNLVFMGGKVPLVRCTDVAKYATLQKINQPNVIVVENVGGTNYQIAKTHLQNAQLLVVKENKS